MNNELIKRNLAISYAVSGLVRRIDGEDWIKVSEVKQSLNDAPTVTLPGFKEGYKQAIIDGKTNFSRPQGDWIPVSERLPENNDAVNITWVNRNPVSYYADIKDKPFVATGHYHRGKWYWFSECCQDYLNEYGDWECCKVDKDIDIIAWKPLPKPYESEGKQ